MMGIAVGILLLLVIMSGLAWLALYLLALNFAGDWPKRPQ